MSLDISGFLISVAEATPAELITKSTPTPLTLQYPETFPVQGLDHWPADSAARHPAGAKLIVV